MPANSQKREDHLKAFRQFFVVQKIRFFRGYGYFSFIGIAYLVSFQLQHHLAQHGINASMFWVFPLSFVIVWFLGYLELKLGFFSDEVNYLTDNSPRYVCLQESLDNILKEIKYDRGSCNKNHR